MAFRRLWVPHYNLGEVRGWNAQTLARDVDGMPDVVVDLPAGSQPNAVAFDANDAMWVTDRGGNRLLRFTEAQLAASGAPTPATIVDSDGTSLLRPIGLAFDPAGNLWVAAAERLEMFTPADLAQSRRATPTRVLVPDRVDIPAGITFDRAGNLWMTDASFTLDRNFVLAFTPQDQTIGGLRAPILRLSSGAFALVEGLQFDARGDLWVANNDGFTVVRFAAARLELPFGPSVRTLAPDTALESDADDSPTGRTVRKPGGLAFDRDGNLFVNSQRGANPSDVSAIVRFSAAQLAALEQPEAVQARTIISLASSNPGFGGLALEME